MSGEHDRSILLLAFAGACVDAISFLEFGQVFTANMTGNTILFVLAFSQRDLPAIARAGVALGGFVSGVVLGEWILIHPGSRGKRPLLRAGLFFELAILIVLIVLWAVSGTNATGEQLYLLIVFSALAMGIQSAVVRDMRLQGGIATTYITGTITMLWAGFTDWILSPRLTPEKKRPSRQSPDREKSPFLPAAIWLVYAIGAISGGLSTQVFHMFSLLLPVAAVALAIILLYLT